MSGEKKEYPKEHIDLYQQIKWNGWGDTRKFLHQLKPSGTIAMTTPELSSVPLPSLRGFIKKELSLPGEEDKPFVLEETPSLQVENIHVEPPKQYPEFVRELKAFFLPDQLKDDKLARITHTFGKSLRDLIRVRM
ncbi:hypothetical protein ACTA71_012126 [Dictyostelium dimigraforme]